jgi:hypothetical protein
MTPAEFVLIYPHFSGVSNLDLYLSSAGELVPAAIAAEKREKLIGLYAASLVYQSQQSNITRKKVGKVEYSLDNKDSNNTYMNLYKQLIAAEAGALGAFVVAGGRCCG